MITVQGEYTDATIISDNVEQYAIDQIKQLCDLPWMEGNKIVCMADIHPGKVSTIGFTMKMKSETLKPIMPSIVGNDIGCGVTTVKLHTRRKKIEFQKLDTVIRDNIPTGFSKRNSSHRFYDMWRNKYNYENYIHANFNEDKVAVSLGTLGGGNHFIEVDQDEDGEYYLTIHSGSRSLGAAVYQHYMELADLETNGNGVGREIPRELSYLKESLSQFYYLQDVRNCIKFAFYNRLAIIDDICKNMKWDYDNAIDCFHNYIDEGEDTNYRVIIRKGAIGANPGQDVIIPINMKDGIIIGKGKSTEEYNYSAPHGSGRVGSRKAIKETHTLKEYKTVMNGVYSPTICKETLDEAPFAYRQMDDVLESIKEVVEIEKIIKPVYNYKGV